jgi:endonuclease III
MQTDKNCVKEIIRILKKEYPESRTALFYANPLQLLVATILSAQCTDKKVNEITPALFKKYKTVEDLADSKPEEIERMIKPAGFYRNKAKNIIKSAAAIKNDYNGKVPNTMEELVKLPGVARKTANIVLSSAFGVAEGIAVDTHVKRLAGRLGLSANENPDKIERDLMKIVPRSEWLYFNYLIVNHGRKVCTARAPRCDSCGLKRLCRYYKTGGV